MEPTNWDKFRLLMWKNWRLQLHHKKQLLVEILAPIIFTLLLVLVRSLVDPKTINEPIKYPPQNIDNLDNLRNLLNKNTSSIDIKKWGIAYSPPNQIIEKILKNAVEHKFNMTVESCLDNEKLEDVILNKGLIAGITFEQNLINLKELPKKLSYNIRFPSELRTIGTLQPRATWQTNNLFPVFQLGGPRNINDSDGGLPPGYIPEGFAAIQHAISYSFIQLLLEHNQNDLNDNLTDKMNSTSLPNIVMQRFPYPPFTEDPLLQGLETFISLMVMLCFIYPCSFIVKFVTTEKEKQLKEVMKIMGLPNWLHWTAWFVKCFLSIMFSMIIMTFLMKAQWIEGVAVLTYTHWSCLLFFLIIYAISAITFCFMISTFFSRANTAAAVTGLLWFIMYLPFSFTRESYNTLNLSQKLGINLFCNSAMGYGFMLILQFEGTGEGLQWYNMFRPVSIDDDMSVGHTIIMMLIDSLIHMLLALYIEQIYPGDFGVPKKWYFPLTKEFWFKEPKFSGITDSYHMNGNSNNNIRENFESDPVNKMAGIQINGLRKVFGKKAAVCGLTLNMYENDITVLLGHNGAGKSTTISMLTGMFPPTSGTALVNGYDIRQNIEKARSSLGLCPQHNILYDELTVREHIIFYSRLKGVSYEKMNDEIDRYTKILGLEAKKNVQSSKLSGGMKRKLSVGVALCGNSKVVLLDEPSSGMDSAARRSLWDLLQQEKYGRTILISTHFMDEADVLGDRIAIMSDGELKCCGTSFFLKKKFGVGYNLICVKRKGCDSKNVTELLRKYVPDIHPDNDIGAELSYQLPYKYSKIFKKMLENLENSSNELNLDGYGISITTMEEVFMKIGKQKDDDQIIMNGNALQEIDKDHESISTYEESLAESEKLLKGKNLIINQWKAMMYKKILNTIRNSTILFIQNFMPIFFITVTILIIRHAATFLPLRPRYITLNSYSTSVTILDMNDSNTTVAEHNIGNNYEKIINSYGKLHKFIRIGNDNNENFENYILEKSNTILVWINSRYFAAATIQNNNIIAWFNNQAFHTVPLSLNLIHNALLKSLFGNDYNIDVTNYPLPYTASTRFEQVKFGRTSGFQLALNISFCMSFVSAFYILFLIKERISRAKLLQLVGGLSVPIFWLSAFLWDYVTYIVTALIAIITLAAFQEEGWSTFDELGRAFFVLLLFGFCVLPFTYLMSLMFSEPATGFTRLSIINIFTGMACFIVVFVMSFNLFDLKDVSDRLTWIFMIFPHFSLAHSLNKLYSLFSLEKACNMVCKTLPSSINCTTDLQCVLVPMCCTNRNYFGWNDNGIGPDILYMICSGIIIFAILLIKEMGFIDDLFYVFDRWRIPKTGVPDETYDDDDVREEKNRVRSMTMYEIESKNLVLNNVTKYYKKFLAVNHLSVAVNHSECFGLLGVNGAGKTTTFKMLTGDERISDGVAYVRGINLKTNMKSVYQEIGYCPQFDGLLEQLTGREMLRIFCYLRGIPNEQINNTIITLTKGLGFLQHLDKKILAYSGGNKRKLSTAIALMGPSVIYLDEPTTGMDPGARRQLWNMVIKIRDSGKSIVLTSHSMEECEALCTRLAIMVNGEFKCLGSLQHLKNKFSKGFILKLKTKLYNEQETIYLNHNSNKNVAVLDDLIHLGKINVEVEKLKRFVETSFPEAVLKEQYRGILTFHIPVQSIKWSYIFGLLEDNKERFNIEDYSISQTTLEEIFLEFAKQQKEDLRET